MNGLANSEWIRHCFKALGAVFFYFQVISSDVSRLKKRSCKDFLFISHCVKIGYSCNFLGF